MVASLIDQVVEDRNIDAKQWRANVVDLKRVMSIAKSAFLLLEHSNEACLRVAVEIVTDKVAKKTLWWNDNWVADSDQYEYFKKIVHGKLNSVLTSVSGMAMTDLEEPPDKDAASNVDVADLQKRLQAAETASKAMMTQQKNAELQCRDAQNELEEALSRIASLEKSVEGMREAVKSSEAEANELKKQAEAEANKPKEAAAPPKAAPQAAGSSPEDKKRIAELEKQMKEAQDQKKAAEEAQKKAEEGLKVAKAEVESVKKDKDAAVKEAAKAKAESSKKGGTKVEAASPTNQKDLGDNERAKAAERRIAELEAQLQEAADERTEIQKKHLEAKEMLQQAQSDAEAAQAAAQKLEAEKKHLEEEKAQAQREQQQLQQQNQQLQKELKTGGSKKPEAAPAPTSNSANADVEAINAKLSAALQDLEDQRRKAQELQQANSDKQAEIEAMTEQANAAEKAASVAQKKLEKAQSRMGVLEEQLSAAGKVPPPAAVDDAEVASKVVVKKQKEDPELEELRAKAALVDKLQEKLAKKREEMSALREELEESEDMKSKMSRTLAQVRDQLKRVTEIAERKGCGDLIKEILEEAEVSKTVSSADFSCFARLWEDAVRRQKKAKALTRGSTDSGSEEEGGKPGFLRRGAREGPDINCPSCQCKFGKDGRIRQAGQGDGAAAFGALLLGDKASGRPSSGGHPRRSSTSPLPSVAGESLSPRGKDGSSRPTSAMRGGLQEAARRATGQAAAGGAYKTGYDEGYRAGIEAARDGGSLGPGHRGREHSRQPSARGSSAGRGPDREGFLQVIGHGHGPDGKMLHVPPSGAGAPSAAVNRTTSKGGSICSGHPRASVPGMHGMHGGDRDDQDELPRSGERSAGRGKVLDQGSASAPNLHSGADRGGDRSGSGSRPNSRGGSRPDAESGERLYQGHGSPSRPGTAQGRPFLDNPALAGSLGRPNSRPGTGSRSGAPLPRQDSEAQQLSGGLSLVPTGSFNGGMSLVQRADKCTQWQQQQDSQNVSEGSRPGSTGGSGLIQQGQQPGQAGFDVGDGPSQQQGQQPGQAGFEVGDGPSQQQGAQQAWDEDRRAPQGSGSRPNSRGATVAVQSPERGGGADSGGRPQHSQQGFDSSRQDQTSTQGLRPGQQAGHGDDGGAGGAGWQGQLPGSGGDGGGGSRQRPGAVDTGGSYPGQRPGQASSGSRQGSGRDSAADHASRQRRRSGAHDDSGQRQQGSSQQYASSGQQGGRNSPGSDRYREEGRSGGGKKRPASRPEDRQKVDHGSLEWKSGNYSDSLDDGLNVIGHSIFGESDEESGRDSGGEGFRKSFRDGAQEGVRHKGPVSTRQQHGQARDISPSQEGRQSISRPNSRLGMGTPSGSTYEGLDSSNGFQPRSQAGQFTSMVISGVLPGGSEDVLRPQTADSFVSQVSTSTSRPSRAAGFAAQGPQWQHQQQSMQGRRMQHVKSEPGELPQISIRVGSQGVLKSTKSQDARPGSQQDVRPHWRRRKSQEVPFASDEPRTRCIPA